MGKSKAKPEKPEKGGPRKLPHCKICHCEVTPNDGLQCKGPCRKWAHFECLDMTAGKIADIKSGAIIINCPCPNCEPSEYRAEVPYNCFNKSCPFNLHPQCTTSTCQKNSSKPKVPPPPPICGVKPKPTVCGNESASDEEEPTAVGSSTTNPGSQASKGRRRSDNAEERFEDDEVELRQPKPLDDDSNRSKTSRRVDSRTEEAFTLASEANVSPLTHPCPDEAVLLPTLENMCDTVAQLSCQLKDLMIKVMKKDETDNIHGGGEY